MYSGKVVVLGQGLLCSDKSCCTREKVILFGHSGCVRVKEVVFGQSSCIRAKVVVLG